MHQDLELARSADLRTRCPYRLSASVPNLLLSLNHVLFGYIYIYYYISSRRIMTCTVLYLTLGTSRGQDG